MHTANQSETQLKKISFNVPEHKHVNMYLLLVEKRVQECEQQQR